MSIVELLARISLAFTRTVDFVMKGAFGDVVLWDVGIIAATSFVGLVCVGYVALVALSQQVQ